MSRFPSAALLDAGLLKSRCDEAIEATCPECGGLRPADGSACTTCFNGDAPRPRCLSCKQFLKYGQERTARDCLSRQAYEADPNLAPIFSEPDEKLWGLKSSAVSALQVVREADLRRGVSEGNVDASALLSSDGGASFLPLNQWPDWRALAEDGLARRRESGVEGLRGDRDIPLHDLPPKRGIGLAYMAGPTGGYLAGFLAGFLVAAGGGYLGKGHAAFAGLLAALASATGGWMAWSALAPALAERAGDLSTIEHWLLAMAYAGTIVAGWFVGFSALFPPNPGVRFRRFMYLGWPAMMFGWPSFGALSIWGTLLATHLSSFAYWACVLAGLGLAGLAVFMMVCGCAALGVAVPSPSRIVPERFDGLNNKYIWLLVFVTAALNWSIWNQTFALPRILLLSHGQRDPRATPPMPPPAPPPAAPSPRAVPSAPPAPSRPQATPSPLPPPPTVADRHQQSVPNQQLPRAPARPAGAELDGLSLREIVVRSPDAATLFAAAQRRRQIGRHDDALVLLEEAVERVHAPAMTVLARLYDPNGFQAGTPFNSPNPREAARLYRDAARAGDAGAMAPRAALRAWLEEQAQRDRSAEAILSTFWP